MAKRRIKKQPSRGPSRRSVSRSLRFQLGIPEDLARAGKRVRQLVRGRTSFEPAAIDLARETIAKLVVEPRQSRVDVTDQILFLLSCNLSSSYLPGYATLDSDHIRHIGDLISTIQRYVDDSSQKRPLNFLMLASPGAGKSHFIKCIAERLRSRNISAITFNMAGLQSHEDLIPPLDAARNLKVEDRIPLLFLDEFDSRPSNISLLLPLLWDGELNIGQRDLKLGKVIIVLAGSDPTLPATMDIARSMRHAIPAHEGGQPKLIDLLSRINGGVLPIPSFYDVSLKIDRRPDKVCVAVQLLRQRFGRRLRMAPLGLLSFIARADFRYGVRSIAHLIDIVPHKKNATALKLGDLKLPLNSVKALKESSVAYHLLHEDQVHGVVSLWKDATATKAAYPLYSEIAESVPSDLPDDVFSSFVLRRMAAELRGGWS